MKLLAKPISNTLMGSVNMSLKLPEIIVFAGLNGSGKSTITRLAKILSLISMLMILKAPLNIPI